MAAGGEFYGSLDDCKKLFADRMKDYDRFLPAKIERLEIRLHAD